MTAEKPTMLEATKKTAEETALEAAKAAYDEAFNTRINIKVDFPHLTAEQEEAARQANSVLEQSVFAYEAAYNNAVRVLEDKVANAKKAYGLKLLEAFRVFENACTARVAYNTTIKDFAGAAKNAAHVANSLEICLTTIKAAVKLKSDMESTTIAATTNQKVLSDRYSDDLFDARTWKSRIDRHTFDSFDDTRAKALPITWKALHHEYAAGLHKMDAIGYRQQSELTAAIAQNAGTGYWSSPISAMSKEDQIAESKRLLERSAIQEEKSNEHAKIAANATAELVTLAGESGAKILKESWDLPKHAANVAIIAASAYASPPLAFFLGIMQLDENSTLADVATMGITSLLSVPRAATFGKGIATTGAAFVEGKVTGTILDVFSQNIEPNNGLTIDNVTTESPSDDNGSELSIASDGIAPNTWNSATGNNDKQSVEIIESNKPASGEIAQQSNSPLTEQHIQQIIQALNLNGALKQIAEQAAQKAIKAHEKEKYWREQRSF